MSTVIVNFNDIQKVLEPIFGGKDVKIILTDKEVFISAEMTTKKALKARGIFNECANQKLLSGEKGAWERAVAEKYAANHDS